MDVVTVSAVIRRERVFSIPLIHDLITDVSGNSEQQPAKHGRLDQRGM